MAQKKLQKGDAVSWKSSQGTIHGTVESKTTKRSAIKKHTVAASTDNPEFIVRSTKTGKKAAHKASALNKT